MHRLMTPLLLASLALVPDALAQTAHPGALARLAQVTYVGLGYDTGRGFVSELDNPVDVLPEERLALNAIREDIERWGKYIIVTRPSQAELLIAVRKGRLLTVGPAVGTGRGGLQQPGGVATRDSWGVGAALSTPEDMLEVFDADRGRVGAQLWRGIEKGGLNGNPPPLFAAFRADVELMDRTRDKDEPPETEEKR